MSLNLLIYLKRCKVNSAGKSPLFIRISINGQRVEVALKRSIDPQNWDSKRQCVSGRNDEVRSINDQIQAFKLAIYNHYNKLIAKSETIRAIEIKNAFLGIDRKRKTVIEVFEYHNKQMQEQIGNGYSIATFKKYVGCLTHVKTFMQKHYHSNVFLDCIDFEFITEFEHYLRVVKNCSNNTTVKYIKNFKKIINMARGYGWLQNDPFVRYKAKINVIVKEILDETELSLLQSRNFTINRLQFVKDIFVFCCFTGLSYSDVKKLTNTNIIVGIDGNNWIVISRTKTNILSKIPLLPPAEEILRKYKDNPLCGNSGLLLPVLSNQKMNAYLKEIADCCHIKKNLTFHAARHTFATTVAISNKVPLETLSKIMGHTSVKYTQQYGKVNEFKISEDMNFLRIKYSSPEELIHVQEFTSQVS